MKSFRRNLKAISPIFATLILIAIAVIAGVVVYMFTTGFLAGNTANTGAAQEKVTVQGVDATGVVLAQNTGGVDVIINAYLIKDSSGTTQDSGTLATAASLSAGGALGEVTVPLTGLTKSGVYTVTLISSLGGSFVSPSFNFVHA